MQPGVTDSHGTSGKLSLGAASDVTSTLAALVGSVGNELAEPIDRILMATGRVHAADLAYEDVLQLNEVKASAASLVTVINGLHDLVHAWGGELTLDAVTFSIRGLVHEAVAAVTSRAGVKLLQLTSSVAPDLDDTLIGDPGRLRDVVMRLLREVVDAAEHGAVRIAVSGVETPRNTVNLRFDIEGPTTQGSDDSSARLDRPNSGVDSSLSGQLTSVVVTAMGGQVWIDDRAVVHLLVELGVGATSQPDRPAAPGPPPVGLPVLIVADSADDRRALLAGIGSAGMAPIAVTHPDETPAAWRAEANGEGAARAAVIYGFHDPFATAEAFLNQTQRRIPVTLVVRSGRRGDATLCRALGIAGYLAMPIVQSDLVDAVMATVQAPDRERVSPSLITRHLLREGRSSLRVLLADPSPTSQRLVIDILEARGHAVTAVADGAAAVEALSTSSFDVVAVDMQRPSSADGVDAATTLRASQIGARIPIVAITSYSGQTEPVRLLTVGVDHRLAKPWRPEELTVAIENAAAAG